MLSPLTDSFEPFSSKRVNGTRLLPLLSELDQGELLLSEVGVRRGTCYGEVIRCDLCTGGEKMRGSPEA